MADSGEAAHETGGGMVRILRDDPRASRDDQSILATRLGAMIKNGRQLMIDGSLTEAIALFEQAAQLAPDEPKPIEQLAIAYELKAQRLREQAARLAGPGVKVSSSARRRDIPAPPPRVDGGVRVSSYAGPRLDPSLPPSWPNRRIAWSDVGHVFRQYVLAETPPERGLLTADSRIVTMGSCFAENVSEALAAHGAKVHYQYVKEDLNSTFANERLVEWALNGPGAPDGEILEEAFGAEAREGVRDALQTCDAYIFSMGVAPVVVGPDGKFVLRLNSLKKTLTREGLSYQTTGPRENADSVRGIIRQIRAVNPRAEIFLTLSPVPLAATFERPSAVLADCLSKSSLRLAVEDVMADHIDGVRYWPSFEMAKWWGAHLRERYAFADDGKTRHVSPWMVETIVDLFVDHYGDESLGARPLSPG